MSYRVFLPVPRAVNGPTQTALCREEQKGALSKSPPTRHLEGRSSAILMLSRYLLKFEVHQTDPSLRLCLCFSCENREAVMSAAFPAGQPRAAMPEQDPGGLAQQSWEPGIHQGCIVLPGGFPFNNSVMLCPDHQTLPSYCSTI